METVNIPQDNISYSEAGAVIAVMNDGFVSAAQISPTQCVFAGFGHHNVVKRMIEPDQTETVKMLICAVNNRTRQRNYFRLLSEVLQGNISDDDFDRIIDENPDDYVLSETDVPDERKMLNALMLSRDIKDVNNTEDISMLFSFDSAVTDRIARQLENHADIR